MYIVCASVCSAGERQFGLGAVSVCVCVRGWVEGWKETEWAQAGVCKGQIGGRMAQPGDQDIPAKAKGNVWWRFLCQWGAGSGMWSHWGSDTSGNGYNEHLAR